MLRNKPRPELKLLDLAPGDTVVTHAELPDGRFSFTLQVIHPRLGHMIRQIAMFREVVT